MINNEDEYFRMYELERKLWWYKILHKKVLSQVRKNLKKKPAEIKVLDAACGTGGLLMFLKEHGFQQVSGFDYSTHAVAFSQKRGLNVIQGDLRNVHNFKPGEKFDLICCNDALYFLSKEEIRACMRAFADRLEPEGIVLINVNAFEAFSGTHDIAVGSSKRYTMGEFLDIVRNVRLKMTAYTYWPFLLSLPIWLVRSWQRFRMNKGGMAAGSQESDVKYPGGLPNNIFYITTKMEEILPDPLPFGSSLFMVFRK